MRLTDEEAARLRKVSILSALLVLLGLGVVGFFIGRNVVRLNDLEAQIAERRDTVQELHAQLQALRNEIYTLRYSPTDTITVRAHASAIPGIKEDGKQVYDFTIWIDLSSYRLKKVTQATYKPAGQYMPFSARVADKPASGFSINYRGTRCLGRVMVDLEFADGSAQSTESNVCEALGWVGGQGVP